MRLRRGGVTSADSAVGSMGVQCLCRCNGLIVDFGTGRWATLDLVTPREDGTLRCEADN